MPPADWQACESTAVEAFRWADGTLELLFVDGRQVYDYPCDAALYERFLAAPSKGRFVNELLKPHADALGHRPTPYDWQRAQLRREFALQAETFESRDYLFTDADVLAWIDRHTRVGPMDRILDAAGGTGALGKHLAQRAAWCVVLDLVPEMLAAGAAAGRRDVLYVEGDATAMPFADAQFDLVVTRFAVHHIDDPARAFAEMARVAVPGGRVVVIDMVDGGADHNALERLRDPSHARALTREELLVLLHAAGVSVGAESTREHSMNADRWLAQAHGARAQVESALRAEAAGGPPTGLHATLQDGRLRITQTWLLLAGSVP